MNVSEKDLHAFIGGKHKCSSPEVAEYIDEQRKIFDSDIYLWYEDLSQRAADTPGNLDWEAMTKGIADLDVFGPVVEKYNFSRRLRRFAWYSTAALLLISATAYCAYLAKSKDQIADDKFKIVLQGDSVSSFGSLPTEWESEVRKLLEDPFALVPLQLASVTRGTGFYSYPNNTKVVSDCPKFGWKDYPDANKYFLYVYDSKGGLAQEPPKETRKSELLLDGKLKRGQTYTWEVRVEVDSERHRLNENRARFSIIDDSTLEFVKQTQKKFSNSHLIMASAYLRLGLIVDARKELTQLAKKNPSSKTLEKVLEQLQ